MCWNFGDLTIGQQCKQTISCFVDLFAYMSQSKVCTTFEETILLQKVTRKFYLGSQNTPLTQNHYFTDHNLCLLCTSFFFTRQYQAMILYEHPNSRISLVILFVFDIALFTSHKAYLPIIQAPAHQLGMQLNTAVQWVSHVVQTLEQKHIVLTVDEALYPKLMEFKGSVSE